jgi:hypothetical protein
MYDLNFWEYAPYNVENFCDVSAEAAASTFRFII